MHILKNGVKNSIRKAYLSSKVNHNGFTLVELIIVIAVMTFLGWMLVPIWGRYIAKNKQTVCRHNRENILKIYERCVYDTSVDISTQGDAGREDLNKIVTGLFPITNSEVYQYQFCPKARDMRSHYEGNIRTNGNNTIVASIGCDTCEDEVSITLDFWMGGNHGSGVDMEITPLPDVSRAPGEASPTPTQSVLSPTPTPSSLDNWPWADEERWWDPDMFDISRNGVIEDKALEDSDPYIKLKNLTLVVDKNNGQRFVYIDTGDTNQKIRQSEAESPTNFSSKHPNWLIPLTGTVIEYHYDDDMLGDDVWVSYASNGDIIRFIKDGEAYNYLYYTRYNQVAELEADLNKLGLDKDSVSYLTMALNVMSWSNIKAEAPNPVSTTWVADMLTPETEKMTRLLYYIKGLE